MFTHNCSSIPPLTSLHKSYTHRLGNTSTMSLCTRSELSHKVGHSVSDVQRQPACNKVGHVLQSQMTTPFDQRCPHPHHQQQQSYPHHQQQRAAPTASSSRATREEAVSQGSPNYHYHPKVACCIALALKSYRKMCMQHVYSTHVRDLHKTIHFTCKACMVTQLSFVTCLLNIGVSSLI